MSGLFEHLAASDDSAYIAHRKASAVALKRVRDRFGAFLTNARGDLPARLALIDDDITSLVREVVAEHGGDAQRIEAAIRQSIVPPMGGGAMGLPGQGAPGAVQPGGQQTCRECGGPTIDGQCQQCNSSGAGAEQAGAAGLQGGAYGMTHAMPQGPSTGPVMAAGAWCETCHGWKSGPGKSCVCDGSSTEDKKDAPEKQDKQDKAPKGDKPAFLTTGDDDSDDDHEPGAEDKDHESSVRTARRPKLCPYHSEVVDISLGSGDPQSGYQAMASHAWGDRHCKGDYEGTCNFRPTMVTQSYWDDKASEYAENAQQRAQDRLQQPSAESLSLDSEPIMHAEPLTSEPGQEGVTDIDGELANAPSAVGGGELAMAASTRKGEALKTEKLPTGDDTALGGPSPKIDKGNSGDVGGWSLEPIDTQMSGSPNPSQKQDPTDRADYNKKDFLDQTRAVTKTDELDSAPDLMNDAGFAPGGEEHGPHTDTWSGKGGQANPVTQTALSAREAAGEWAQPYESNMYNYGVGNPLYDKATEQWMTNGQADPAKADQYHNYYADQHNQMESGAIPADPAWRQWRESQPIAAQFGPRPGQPQPGAPYSALSAVDPDKNPIREIMEQYRGHLMPNEVESALGDWEVG